VNNLFRAGVNGNFRSDRNEYSPPLNYRAAVDIHMAGAELEAISVSINIEEHRELANDDEVWQQEVCAGYSQR
jgi:hypothetical protein